MKTIALLGGMTPDVTTLYYQLINQHIRQKLGARHSAKLYIYSVDLEEQLQRVQAGDWDAFAAEYIGAIQPLTSGRVQGVALGAIIAHKASSRISASLPASVAFLDVADFVARHLSSIDVAKVGLIGPDVTMTDKSDDFFVGKLEKAGISVLVPDTEEELKEVNRGMFEEVVRGKAAVTADTANMFRHAAAKLLERGAKALILGSTDLGFVLQQNDFPGTPVLDVAYIHAQGLAEWALNEL